LGKNRLKICISSVQNIWFAHIFFEEERTLEYYKKLPQLLNKSGETTNEAEIAFAYHNHDFEFEKFDDKTVYDFILNNTDSDLVNMELDLYWISKAGFNPLTYFEKYRKDFRFGT
jgi:sugar phosphate isomerase/epimerase